MGTTKKNIQPIWRSAASMLLITAFIMPFTFIPITPMQVSADSVDTFGPACGFATIDGEVDPAEWSGASSQTILMVSPGSAPQFTMTLHVMNSGTYLYIGITINDDEFSTLGQYLPKGDGFRIDFDNDHSGTLFSLGDDVLGLYAAYPQFEDNYIYISENRAATSDTDDGGTSDGIGAASRKDSLNHFELRHPLCSGDTHDFCLHAGDTVGFRVEYLDAEANGDFGGSQFYPGTGSTSEADIVIGTCSAPDVFLFLPVIMR
jgi:hypothetical protein